MKAIHAVGNLLSHAANIATDHRSTVEKRLLYYERRVLPPDRGHNYPIHIRHKLREFVWVVAADERHVLLGSFEQLVELVLVRRILQIQVSSMKPEVSVALLVFGKDFHSLEQHMHAFEGSDLAEKANAVPRGTSHGNGRAAVL